ncbi:MAG: DNA repair protein RecO [Nitrospinota bacterium]|nr:DNA repair protein RecO [Nitrospinota bacterium]
MGIYNSEGIVLNKIAFSNTSLIVSYLTKSFGKIKLVCKGVRASKKQTGVRFEPGTLVELEWYRKDNSELGTLRSCDSVKIFRRIWEDYESMQVALRMIKTIDRLFSSSDAENLNYEIFKRALRAIEDGRVPKNVECTFLLGEIVALGFTPSFNYCEECNLQEKKGEVFFNIENGELRCSSCKLSTSHVFKLSQGTILTILETFRSDINGIHDIKIISQLQEEIISLGYHFLSYHCGINLGSITKK